MQRGHFMKMTGEQALEKIEKQIARQNEYNKANYDRLGTTFKKGTAERIKNLGFSYGGFLKMAVYEKLDMLEGNTQTPIEPLKYPDTATKTEQTENVPTKEEKSLENGDTSGLTPMNEILNKILAEHAETGVE